MGFRESSQLEPETRERWILANKAFGVRTQYLTADRNRWTMDWEAAERFDSLQDVLRRIELFGKVVMVTPVPWEIWKLTETPATGWTATLGECLK